MKLYAFQPEGHGEYSFFVMAESEEKARQAVDKWIRKETIAKTLDNFNVASWGTDYYEVTEFAAGEVAINCND